MRWDDGVKGLGYEELSQDAVVVVEILILFSFTNDGRWCKHRNKFGEITNHANE